MNRLLENAGRNAVCLLAATVGMTLVSGCAMYRSKPTAAISTYKPSNVFVASASIPSHIRRVAVLPISAAPNDWQSTEGRVHLEPILSSEVGKIKLFEQVAVTREQLKVWTGQESWLPEESLPPNFFARLAEGTGCDAVLFTRLYPFHAYRPVVVGWEMKLVDVRQANIVWAADEVFDGGEPSVAAAAVAYFHDHGDTGLDRASESSAVLSSPRRFSAYTLAALLATLPRSEH